MSSVGDSIAGRRRFYFPNQSTQPNAGLCHVAWVYIARGAADATDAAGVLMHFGKLN